jgi:hypothetical protein
MSAGTELSSDMCADKIEIDWVQAIQSPVECGPGMIAQRMTCVTPASTTFAGIIMSHRRRLRSAM